MGQSKWLELRHRLEAGAVAGLQGAVGRLPRTWVPRIGRWLGGAAFRLDGKRRRMALSNLEHAYGQQLNLAQRRDLARAYYQHLGRMLFENAVLLQQIPDRPVAEFLSIENPEFAREAIEEHGSVIYMTCHVGPWELLAAGVSALGKKPIHSLYRPIKNPYLDRRLAATRAKLGLPTIRASDRRAVVALLRLLERDECIAILCDLNHRQNPVFADFFGRPAATVRLPGFLAVRSGKPILCGYSWCTSEPYRYRARLERPILARKDADPEAEVERIVRAVVASDEAFIREHPEQWHWNYNRWKTQP